MKNLTQWLVIPAALAAAVFGSPNCDADELAIKAGKIIPIAGDPIEDGVILVRDGRITAVGQDLTVPIEARVIDASEQVVMPGFVDPHNSTGMSQANERNANVPFTSVVDSIDPNRPYFEECRRNGVTAAAVVPGNSTMIGGQAAILKTAGRYVDDMLLKRFAGIKLSLRPALGTSRMSHFSRLRKELDKAQKALEAEREKKQKSPESTKTEETGEQKKEQAKPASENGSASAAPARAQSATNQTDEGLATLIKLLKQEFPAFIYCDTSMDVGQALRLIDEYKLRAILVLGRDCYKAVDVLAKRNLPLIMDPTLVFWRTDPRTREDEKIVLPRIFREQEVEFVFQAEEPPPPQSPFSRLPNSPPVLGSSYLWYQAAVAVKYGMPRDEALKALTQAPAKLLGIDRFVGTIEAGKDADLVILTGDPLEFDTWVDQTLINGKVVYERARDAKLKKLLEPAAD